MQKPIWLLAMLAGFGLFLDAQGAEYDLIVRNGTLYNGSGKEPVTCDIAINGQNIVAVGKLSDARGKTEIDAQGLAVAPGFINVLSWATESLIEDGRSQSGIRQGVTLEVFGEGESLGPLNDKMKKEMRELQGLSLIHISEPTRL